MSRDRNDRSEPPRRVSRIAALRELHRMLDPDGARTPMTMRDRARSIVEKLSELGEDIGDAIDGTPASGPRSRTTPPGRKHRGTQGGTNRPLGLRLPALPGDDDDASDDGDSGGRRGRSASGEQRSPGDRFLDWFVSGNDQPATRRASRVRR